MKVYIHLEEEEGNAAGGSSLFLLTEDIKVYNYGNSIIVKQIA